MLESDYLFIKSVASEFSKFNIADDVADFIGCQFALESFYGKSSLAKTYNNYSGMKTPLVRVSVALNYRDSKYKWARYDSLASCVYDFMLCLAYRKPSYSAFQNIYFYQNFIRGWYCPEKTYIDRIYKIYVQFKNYQNGN